MSNPYDKALTLALRLIFIACWSLVAVFMVQTNNDWRPVILFIIASIASFGITGGLMWLSNKSKEYDKNHRGF